MLLTIFCLTELFFCLLPIVHHVDLSYLPGGVKNFLDAIAELDARLWLTLIIHEVVEIIILFMVGFLFRPRLLSTFFYIEVDYSQLRKRQQKPPPLYLIPVSSENYACDGGLIVPRSKLSPVDLQFTITSSTPRQCTLRRGYHAAGASHHRRHSSHNRMIVETNHQATMIASGAGQIELVPSSSSSAAAEASLSSTSVEETQLLLGSSASVMVSSSASSSLVVADQETGTLSKAALQYHASRFLVVLQPDNTYMVAVQELGGEEDILDSDSGATRG